MTKNAPDLAILGGLGLVMAAQLPEIQRYLKIRSM